MFRNAFLSMPLRPSSAVPSEAGLRVRSNGMTKIVSGGAFFCAFSLFLGF